MVPYPEAKENVLLILPFTPSIFLDPSPLLPIIYRAAAKAATKTLTVLLCTPGVQVVEEQLYSILLRAPRTHFASFQKFLGRIYATLAAGQWSADHVLLDSEVCFDGYKSAAYPTPDTILMLERFMDIGIDIVHKVGIKPTAISHRPIPIDTTKLLETSPVPGFPVVAVGGTFDHLHGAHKLLLHLTAFLTTQRLIVGVVAGRLLGSKNHPELVESLPDRIAAVETFLKRCVYNGRKDTNIKLDVVEIEDPLGPTATDADIEALVVSRETLSGGEYVNRVRHDKGLSTLEIYVVDVISSSLEDKEGIEDEATTGQTIDFGEEADEAHLKEHKMGSSAIRQWIARRSED